MAQDSNYSSVRGLVVETWNFLVPPTVRTAFALAILLIFCPWLSGSIVELGETGLTAIASEKTIDYLERLKLGGAVPLASFVAVIATAYTANRLMLAIGGLVALGVRIKPELVVGNHPRFAELWRHHPGANEAAGLLHNVEKSTAHLNPDSELSAERYAAKLRNEAGDTEDQEHFLKFLVVWTFWCAAAAFAISGWQPFILQMLIAILGLVLLCLLRNFGLQAQEKRAQLIAGVETALAYAKRTNQQPPQPTEAHQDRIERFRRVIEMKSGDPWWSIKPAPMPLFELLSGFDWWRSTERLEVDDYGQRGDGAGVAAA